KSEDKWNNGFGAAVLGIGWQGHHGRNHKSSTRIDLIEDMKSHPILTGVEKPWAYCGGYAASPPADCNILAMAQPLKGMTIDSPTDEKLKTQSAAWTREYEGKGGKKGRVFCTTYGSSNCIENDGFRRMLINACFWGLGLESKIVIDSNIDFVGPFNPTFGRGNGRRKAGLKPLDMSGWESPIIPLQKK
ncbi:MAG: ThuA domain-containing protein, partial [Lentisphaeraceae bacterium]|nr:ThuA domain-containing protein [Lentisphaeraceae bacterium]